MSEGSDHEGAEETKRFQENVKRKKIKSRMAIESDSENEEVAASVHLAEVENVEDGSESSEGDEEDDDDEEESGSEGDEEGSEGEESSEGEDSSNSEWESQSESGSSEEEEKEATSNDPKPSNAPAAAQEDYSSDTSDGTSEKCPICLKRFTDQEVGTPESCDHSFCAVCLQEWSKTVNTCPVDRQEFSLILVRRRVEGKVIRREPVEVKAKDEEPPDDPTYCEVCGNCDREDRMLLCDGCDMGFHLECLTPPLEHVPIEEWFCPECAPTEARRARLDATIDRVIDMVDLPLEVRTTHRAIRARVLPRTLQMERIRVQVVSAVAQRRSDDLLQPSTSIGADSDENAGPSKSWRKVTRKRVKRYVKRKTTKKKSSTKKRKPTTRKTSTKSCKSTTGKRRKVSKRKTGKRKKRKVSSRPRRASRTARVVIPQSVRGRLAEQLGMRPLRQPWQTVPEVRSAGSAPANNINFQRFRAGIPTLHLFGQRDQLDYFSGSDDEYRDMEGGGGTAVAATARPALSMEHRLSNRKRLLAAQQRPSAAKAKIQSIQPAGDCDIVGSILSSQSKWLSAKKSDVVINRDGSLDFKSKEPPKKEAPPTQPQPTTQLPNPLERLEETRVNVKDSSAEKHIAKAPLYPNSGGGGRGPRGGGGVNNFNFRGRPSGGSPVGTFLGASGSNFRSPYPGGSPGFGPQNTRAQYEHFLGNNAQNNPQPRNPPLRFRLNNPRVPLRRNPGLLNRRQGDQNQDERNNGRRPEHGGRGDGAKDEEDDVDIYSDIEPDSAGREGSEQEESGEREYGTLMPPPEPPALLMAGFGDVGSDDDASDSELVIDDRWASSPKGNKVDGKPADQEEEKYDPAEPSHDSENEDSSAILADDIPLPPDKPPEQKLPADTTTEDPLQPAEENPASDEPEKVEAAKADDDEDSNSSKQEKPESEEEKSEEASPVAADETSNSDKPPSPNKDEDAKDDAAPSAEANEHVEKVEKAADESSESDDDDCPNFSIYSAASMELARRTGEEEGGKEAVKDTGAGKEESDKSDDEEEKDAAASCVEGKEGSDSPAPDSRTKADGDVESDPEAEVRKEALLEVNVEKDEARESSESAREDDSDDERELRKKRRRASSNSDEDGPADSTEKIPLKKRHDDDDDDEEDDEEDKGKDAQHLVDEIFGSDDDSLVGGATSAVSTGTLENVPVASVVPGLEGLETETISETEEAINFDDISDEEVARKRKKKSRRRSSGEDGGKRSSPTARPTDSGEFEEGEILDESLRDQHKKDRKEKEAVADENVDTSKAKSSPPAEEDKRRKKKKAPSKERAVVSSSENKSKGKDKSSKDDISWKKPSKSTRDRNYRDGKEKKDDREERENSRSRKKKEKRKDLERYDVRKVLSDKTLSKQNKDAFGRDIDRRRSQTRSRSRARSQRRSRSRSRSRARSSSRTRARGRRQSRGRSRSRSRHRSPLRSKDRPRRSRSKDKKKRASRERDRSKRSRSKNRSGSRNRNRSRASPPRSRSRSPMRNKERRKDVRDESGRVRASWSRSASPSRSWSPSLTGSPQYPVNQAVGRRHDRNMLRSLSRSWSRDPVDRPNNVAATGKRRKNLTVIVTNSKDETRRKKREQSKRNMRRRPSPAPSKEVFASGDNILVSVNFKCNKSAAAASGPAAAKKKREEARLRRARKEKTSKNDAQTEKATSEKRKKVPPEANQKPVAIIDLEQSPFREYTPSPKDVIVLSDSEEDLNQKTVEELEQMHHHITDSEGLNLSGLTSSLDEGQLQSSGHSGVSSYLMTSTGPKTPPEPQIKFSISGKQQLRTITNPLLNDEDEEEEIEDETAENDVDMMTHKGPNTPPESPLGPATPASPTTSPDAYDPFDPTKSRSPSPDQGAAGANGSGSPRADGDAENGPATIDEALPKSAADASDDTKTSPQKAAEADTATKKSPSNTSPGVLPEVSRMLDSLDDAEKKSPVLSADATSTTVAGKAAVSSAGSTEVTSTSSSRANAFNVVASTNTATQRLLGSTIKVRPATKANLPLPKVVPLRQNGEPAQPTDTVDMDLDSSPYSPAPSEGDDLFEPPPLNYGSSRSKSSAPPARAQKTSAATKDKFDNLFGNSPMVANKFSPWNKNAPKVSTKNAAKMNKLVSKHIAKLRKADPGGAGGKMDEDQLKILDEVPSSAVEMQVKDKFLKKLNRQERVVEEVKLALKPHYYKKIINKEDYKEILRRSVPKICHNRSGEINPIKIRGLVEAYVKKVRYLKKKASGQVQQKAKTRQLNKENFSGAECSILNGTGYYGI